MLSANALNLDKSKILSFGKYLMCLRAQIYSIPLYCSKHCINSLPNDKILDWFKLKAFADDNLKVIKMIIYVLDNIQNIVGKGENAGYQHFLLFPNCFQKPFC